MIIGKNEKHKRSKKNGKRSVFDGKRSFGTLKILPLPGKLYYHFIVIAVFISYELPIVRMNGEDHPLWIYLIYYLAIAAVAYGIAHVAFPGIESLGIRRFGKILLCSGTFLLLYLFLLATNILLRYCLTGEFSLRMPSIALYNTLWRSSFVMLLSVTYWLYLNALEHKRTEIALLKDKAEAERKNFELYMAYENSRVNPHFLYNTLQYIHSCVYQLSSDAEIAVSCAAELVRYAFAPVGADGKVPLEEEMQQVARLLTLNHQKNAPVLHMECSLPAQTALQGLRIPPHTITCIVENTIKHGVLDDERSPAVLSINCTDRTLHVHARNRKPGPPDAPTGGIGMANLKTRLEYSYPGSYTLEISNTDDIYDLNLTIRL